MWIVTMAALLFIKTQVCILQPQVNKYMCIIGGCCPLACRSGIADSVVHHKLHLHETLEITALVCG